jgi:enoyl reductase-like protein
MNDSDLHQMTIPELVERFVQTGLRQDDAELLGDARRFRRLYRQMRKVEEELKGRSRDERRALIALYEHPNMQVRWKAAEATLAVAPHAARAALQTVWASQHFPQAADAGMTLKALDEGMYKPR